MVKLLQLRVYTEQAFNDVPIFVCVPLILKKLFIYILGA